MCNPIISVEDLSKSYLVGHQSVSKDRYTALRDVLGRHVKNFARKGLDMMRGRQIVQGDEIEEFWALKNISFEVNEGEVVGIIGRNGAGKSTLLKVLSRITEPTSGRVTLRGRVASLLEVGTGFHPELTGRENIFLNGAILGMKRAEIKRKFEEIVEFAGVQKFLDTPVKRYSSGMYVRLAFAVAAHLEPEILIVDEVLAVGDGEFQKKCLGKMKDVASSGRTVLFVSHSMSSIRNLCSHAILLSKGCIERFGSTEDVVNDYVKKSNVEGVASISSRLPVELKYAVLLDRDGNQTANAFFSEYFSIAFEIDGSSNEHKVCPVVEIRNDREEVISSVCGPEEGIDFSILDGNYRWLITIPSMQLYPGTYYVNIFLYGYEPSPYFVAERAVVFEVQSACIGESTRAYRSNHGIFRLCSDFTEKKVVVN